LIKDSKDSGSSLVSNENFHLAVGS